MLTADEVRKIFKKQEDAKKAKEEEKIRSLKQKAKEFVDIIEPDIDEKILNKKSYYFHQSWLETKEWQDPFAEKCYVFDEIFSRYNTFKIDCTRLEHYIYRFDFNLPEEYEK